MNIPMTVTAARILLTVFSVAIVLAACSDPAPAAEQWPLAPRPTPTPGGMLALPTPEPSTLADEAYAVLNTLTTEYSPRESGTDQEMEAALYLQKNLDALGSGTTLHAIGDYDLTSKAREIGRELGAPITLEGGGMASSDHAPFVEVGIPVLFLSSNDISRINAPEDTIEYINPDLLGYAAEIGIAMLDSLAEEAQ